MVYKRLCEERRSKSSSCSEIPSDEIAMDDKPHSKTFSIMDEDHTFANSVRFALNQDPRVVFCGYSIPHPSENRVNIRVQTTGAPANEVFRDGCQNLMSICQHVRGTFTDAVAEFERKRDSMKQEKN